MYETLLDDFEDDVPQAAEVAAGFQKLPLDGDDEENGQGSLGDASVRDGEIHLDSSDELLGDVDEAETWSDDPVRMYLTQMGEIPLLTRRQEIELAKRIEETRRRFRTKLLENDYVLQEAYKTLKRVHRGELPFDRTVQVSVTEHLEKEQIDISIQTEPCHPGLCAHCTVECPVRHFALKNPMRWDTDELTAGNQYKHS